MKGSHYVRKQCKDLFTKHMQSLQIDKKIFV
jgi:hypothetical protein